MSDNTVITDPKDEKKEKSIGQEVREKSFHQILKEQQEERNKPADETTPEKTDDEKKAEEEKVAKEAEEAKAKEEADKKAEEDKQAQLAKQAAEEVLRKQEDERQREQDRIKAEDAEKARQESLKPKFTDTDEKGNPKPKSYEEVVEEGARIGEERAYARIKAEEAERQAAAEKAAAEKTQNDEQIKKQQEDAEKQLQAELDTDLTDLYATNKLPKIKDPKDENDLGNKEFRNLFETAQKVNAERMAKGQAPIRSIKLIYYEHYKPLPKPAGHDAPVIGSESTISTEPPEDKYVVSRDRNKSIQQLVKEEAARLSKKMGIRSK